MKDDRLLTPETFCDVAEVVEHAEALLNALHRLNCETYRKVGRLDLRDLTDLLCRNVNTLRDMIADDVKASKELS